MSMNRVLIAMCGCALVSTARADLVSFSGSIGDSAGQTGATFSGSIDYTFGGGSSGSVIITLDNDTPPEVGGFLTGFVFNIDSTDPAAAAVLVSSSNSNFLDTGAENASPFGDFLAGAALGGNWQGGGSPSGGIGIGQSGAFGFAVTAADAGALSASSFLSGPNEFNFVVRFRGLTDGGSDKVPVPAPASAGLLAVAAGLAPRRRG